MINGGVAGLVALYLIMVLYQGNENELLARIKSEVGFVKWFAALLVLMLIYRLTGGKIGEIFKNLTLVALGALLLGKGETIFRQIGNSFLPDRSK